MKYIHYIKIIFRDEDDAVSIVLSILEDQSRENVMKIIDEMTDQEVIQMLGVYLVEMIKMKMAQEGKTDQWKPQTITFTVSLRSYCSLPYISYNKN